MRRYFLIIYFIFAILCRTTSNSSVSEGVNLNLRLNDWVVGEIQTLPAENAEAVSLNREQLIKSLENYVEEREIQRLASSDIWIRFSELGILGYKTYFSVSDLEIRIEIPDSFFKKEQILLFGSLGMRERGSLLEPNKTSFFLNVRSQQNFEQPSNNSNYTKGPVFGDYDLALRLSPIVFESFGSTEEGASYPVRRADSRFVFDNEPTGQRWILGDLSFPVIGFQNFQPTLGLGVTKDHTLSPDQVAYSQSDTEIILRRFARVEIWINEILYQTLHLRPGRFNLRSLPLNKGLNRVRVRIVDDSGQETIKDFPFLSENQILAKHMNQFSYNIGVKSVQKDFGNSYENSNKQFSFYHRHGLTNDLTIGLNAQGQQGYRLFGLEGITANDIGVFSYDLGVTSQNSFTEGYGHKLKYRSYEFFKEKRAVAGFGVESRSQTFFRGLSTSTPYEAISTLGEMFIGWRLTNRSRMSVGGSYGWKRELINSVTGLSNYDSSSFYVNLGYSLRINLSGGFEVSRQVINGLEERRATVNLSWFAMNRPTQIYFSNVDQGKGTRLQANYEPRRGGRAYVAVEKKLEQTDYDVSIGFLGNSGTINLDGHQTYDPTLSLIPNGISTTNNYRWRASTAVGMVGGRWFMSRPITDSVAIFEAAPELRGKMVRLNANGNDDDGSFVRNRKIAMPELQSYRTNFLRFSNEQFDSSEVLEIENFRLRPKYKSAFLLPIKVKSSILGRLLLKDLKGNIVSLQGGEIIYLGHVLGTFFTDRNGITLLEGLRPGKTSLRFFDGTLKDIQFEVPNDIKGEWDIGERLVETK